MRYIDKTKWLEWSEEAFFASFTDPPKPNTTTPEARAKRNKKQRKHKKTKFMKTKNDSRRIDIKEIDQSDNEIDERASLAANCTDSTHIQQTAFLIDCIDYCSVTQVPLHYLGGILLVTHKLKLIRILICKRPNPWLHSFLLILTIICSMMCINY